jgi:hypothetical protein
MANYLLGELNDDVEDEDLKLDDHDLDVDPPNELVVDLKLLPGSRRVRVTLLNVDPAAEPAGGR